MPNRSQNSQFLSSNRTFFKTWFGRTLLIILTLIGLAFLGFVCFVGYLIYQFGGGSHPNVAETETTPIITSLVSIHPVKNCDNGDNGYGIDNAQPWYTAYLTVDSNSSLDQTMKSAAQSHGYSLTTDQSFINQLNGVPDANGSINSPLGGEQFNATSTYLTGAQNGKNLNAKIARSGQISLYCSDVASYGHKISIPAGKAIIELEMTFPVRH